MAGYACRAASWLCCVIVCLGVITIIVLANTFHPHTIAATVDSASLVNFTLSPSPAASQLLAYNLTVAVTVRNPNKHAGLYYDDVEVLAFYKGQRFGYHQLESFYQGAKTSTQLNPEFHGLQLLQGGDVVDAAEFRSQQANGSFAIDVGLNANLRVKVLSSKVSGYKANITCKLLVPAPGATNNGATFMPTDCQASLVEPPESPSVQFSGRISIVGAQT